MLFVYKSAKKQHLYKSVVSYAYRMMSSETNITPSEVKLFFWFFLRNLVWRLHRARRGTHLVIIAMSIVCWKPRLPSITYMVLIRNGSILMIVVLDIIRVLLFYKIRFVPTYGKIFVIQHQDVCNKNVDIKLSVNDMFQK